MYVCIVANYIDVVLCIDIRIFDILMLLANYGELGVDWMTWIRHVFPSQLGLDK